MDIFENLCRTCGNECLESLSIYEVSVKALEKMVPIAEMLSACLPANFPVLAPSDDYPKQICRICVKKLTLAYEFNNQWVGAHSEFNVAIKFEERRRRSLASKAQEIKVPELPKPQEIPEVAVEGTLPAATEEQINVGTSVANKDYKNETKRRRRSLASKAQEIKVPELTKRQDIPEVAVKGALPAATEEQIKFVTSVANKERKNESKRRRRSLASKAQESKVPELPKPQEISAVAVDGTLAAATEKQIKFDEVKHNFKCAICDEGFLTEKATKFHRLFTHKFL